MPIIEPIIFIIKKLITKTHKKEIIYSKGSLFIFIKLLNVVNAKRGDKAKATIALPINASLEKNSLINPS